jgi:hypothetical protein
VRGVQPALDELQHRLQAVGQGRNPAARTLALGAKGERDVGRKGMRGGAESRPPWMKPNTDCRPSAREATQPPAHLADGKNRAQGHEQLSEKSGGRGKGKSSRSRLAQQCFWV